MGMEDSAGSRGKRHHHPRRVADGPAPRQRAAAAPPRVPAEGVPNWRRRRDFGRRGNPEAAAPGNAETHSPYHRLVSYRHENPAHAACALGHKACRDGKSVLYHRVPRLFEALALARGDGRYSRLLKSLARVQLLILDDWGLSVLTEAEQRDLLEILEDRHQRTSTIVTSQVPVEQWHEIIGSPTLADAILDRLVHNAHRLSMTGESMRKISAKKTPP
jgi:IstB-like ATP binding protein